MQRGRAAPDVEMFFSITRNSVKSLGPQILILTLMMRHRSHQASIAIYPHTRYAIAPEIGVFRVQCSTVCALNSKMQSLHTFINQMHINSPNICHRQRTHSSSPLHAC